MHPTFMLRVITRADKTRRSRMLNRRTLLAAAAAIGTLPVSHTAFAKEKHHQNGQSLLGGKIKQNGKHKIHTAGKSDVVAEVKDGRVVNLSASGAPVKKVKSRKKLAESHGVI